MLAIGQHLRGDGLQDALLLIGIELGIQAQLHQQIGAVGHAVTPSADRIDPFLTPAERSDLLEQAANYLSTLTDRRGFDAVGGWRHGVAHGADLLMQLSLNSELDAKQQQRILQAVATQVLADGKQAYVFGEGQRLARPALFAALRSDIDSAGWAAWLTTTLAPLGPPGTPIDAARLVRFHNAREFLWPLYFSIAELKDEAARQRLLPAVAQALKSLL